MKKEYFKFLWVALFLSILSMSCSKKSDPKLEEEEEEEQEQIVFQKDLAAVDEEVAAFMAKYNVPGLSLAVSKNEKLVYVKAYGFADKEAGTTLTTQHQFRIASLSKSLTGVAFAKLLEEQKLHIDDRVFGLNGILGTKYGTKAYSSHLLAITVRHLLNHTAGAWGNSNSDPMFLHPNMSTDELIHWTIDNRPVTRDPGTFYDYSNFGYCLLGRIVERITGKSYEQYVKEAILTPSQAATMQLGGNTLADRKSKEVKYYGTTAGGNNPYAYRIDRMDAHGGWIASPTELLRWLVRVDGFPVKPDILKSLTIGKMIERPSLAIPSNYAMGWSVNQANHWWHTGSLPGTSAIMVRANNGYSWAILTNVRSGGNEMGELDNLMWKVLQKNPQWENIDQF
jgi:D-alanyl-D-alanine carboxypeptidase